MNLSPDWVEWFQNHQWPAVHWSSVGDPQATDETIMRWARANQYVVFTHDMDFGTALALTNADGPSVIQVRAQDVFPEHLGRFVLAALRQHGSLLEKGALVVVDENTSRVRILPLRG
jgi:predicted nuclease of predicted toxin-antitoxin system